MNKQVRRKIGSLWLIDDDQVDQMLCGRLVERSDLVDKFRSFLDAREALDFLIANPKAKPDVILLDINMPIMDGFEFLQAVATLIGDDFEVPVIVMLTTSLDDNDREKASKYPFVKDYLSKPLNERHIEQIASTLHPGA